MIELLVVISIIALLVGILLPVLSSARAAGRDVACAAKQNQMMVGWHVAIVDRKDQIPNTINSTSASHPLPSWYKVLEASMTMLPALSNSAVSTRESKRLYCPEIENQFGYVAYSNAYYGYAINCRLRPEQDWGDNEGAAWGSIKAPSAYPWFVDPAVFSAPPIAKAYFAATPTRNWGVGFYHPQTTSRAAFADGHVESIPLEVLSGPTDSNGVPLWLLDGP